MVEPPDLTTPEGDASSISTSYPPPSAIFSLPAEILRHILSFCNLPSLENFRRTSRFSMTFVDPKLLKRAEEDYRHTLFEKEKRYAEAVEVLRFTQEDDYSVDAFNNLHTNPITRAPRLRCYTCYRYLDRDRFVQSQKTGRRSYGHADAMKRFCISCGFKQNKWSRGTRFKGNTLPCVRCQKIALTYTEARELGLCARCFLVSRAQSRGSGIEGRRDSIDGTSATVEYVDGGAVENNNRVQPWAPLCHQMLSDEVNKLSLDVTIAGETLTYVRKGNEWTSSQPDAGTSKRAQRCVRCWMVDHTYRPAVISQSTVERLCASCQRITRHVEGAHSKAPALVPEVMSDTDVTPVVFMQSAN